MLQNELLRSVDDLTAGWLERALGEPVRSFTAVAVGTGQSSSTYRVTLDWDGAADGVILKLADPDPAVRQTGRVTGHSEREIAFYTDVAARLPQTTLATCYAAAYDDAEGYFTLLVEEAVNATEGDQIQGCSVDQARVVVRELARLVGAVVEEPDLGSWLDTPLPTSSKLLEQMLPTYYERFGAKITDEQRSVIDRYVMRFDSWKADATEPRSIVHNDFRLDNMLFGRAGAPRELTIIDWATLKWGSVTSDLAFFIGGNLSIEDRRANEKELVKIFHDTLVGEGLKDFSFEECWRGYRWMAFSGVVMAIGAPLVVTQTERGDELFLTMLQRHAQQVIDLDSLSLLDEVHRENLLVDPADEGRHEPGVERYWNESWYFDAISDDGTLGAYIRVGLVPHLGHTVYTAYIVGEGRPSVALCDYEAPLPAAGMAVNTDAFTSDLIIEEPLQRFRAKVAGQGISYADPLAPLHGQPGTPVDAEIDLVWETDGIPYMYQVTTRYELPCRVSGTVRIGDEVLTLTGVGQRDHSWGDRNWWSMDWTWVSAHLDDGSHFQNIELRLPGMPVMAAGYEQRGDELSEINTMSAAYDIPANRLPGTTRVNLEPTGTELTWEPIAYGPLRVVAPDGRVCEFPRAMARVSTPDGRTGLGWIEWGHNVDPTNDGAAGAARKAAVAAASSIGEGLKGIANQIPERAYEVVMKSRVGRPIVAGIFKALDAKIDPRRAQIADATVRFNVSDVASGEVDTYDLVLSSTTRHQVIRRAADEAVAGDEPRVSIELSGADMLALGLGRLDPMQAALQRRIVLQGDFPFLAVLSTVLAGDAFPPQKELNP